MECKKKHLSDIILYIVNCVYNLQPISGGLPRRQHVLSHIFKHRDSTTHISPSNYPVHCFTIFIKSLTFAHMIYTVDIVDNFCTHPSDTDIIIQTFGIQHPFGQNVVNSWFCFINACWISQNSPQVHYVRELLYGWLVKAIIITSQSACSI